MIRRVLLGELLVEAQVITREALEHVLELQKRDGRRLGTLLVDSGLVTETQVTQILSQQLSIPWVSLYHIDFSRQLLNLVPRELVEKYCLVPIFVRRVRGVGATLYVAMDDPSDERAREQVSHYAGLPVRAMIAPPSDIREAIRVYYGARSAPPPWPAEEPGTDVSADATRAPPAEVPQEGPVVDAAPASDEVVAETLASVEADEEPPTQRAPEPLVARPSTAPAAPSGAAPARVPGTPAAEKAAEPQGEALAAPVPHAPAPAHEAAPESGVPIPACEASMPKPKRGGRPRMITLTLLDGTRVRLPARAPEPVAEEALGHAQGLTARDLITALRAAAHGTDASSVLGEQARWEALFAALLSLLLKKRLIADWEFVDELKEL